MTEREVKRRQRYKERRQKWITIHTIALILVVVAIFGVLFAHDELTKESFIEYAESSDVKYSVKIPKDAPFYSEYLEEFAEFADENGDLWIPSNYAYPTSAATVVKIDIDYHLEVCAPDVDYIYTYRITAQPEVVDGATKSKFPLPKTTLEEVSEPIRENSNTTLDITKSIEIDYRHYNNLVKKFEEQMDIRDATENLIITMEVEVIGTSETLYSDSENTCVIKVTMPLNEHAFDVNYSTSSSSCGDCKILAAHKSNEYLVRMLEVAMILGYIAIGLLAYLLIGIYITKNHDVNYYNKIKRLVNNYRSFIQRIEGGFDTTGYQIVIISTFREMLAIRDTIQSPVLLSENTDKTRAQFFIPTSTKLLYLFEVKVDNYDKLYKKHPDWVDDSIINVSGAAHAPVASAAPVMASAAPEAAPMPVNGQYAAPVTNNNYSSVTNVQNTETRYDRRGEGRGRRADRRSRGAEPLSYAPTAAPAYQGAPANAQYAPVGNRQYAPSANNEAANVTHNGYTTGACASASICVTGKSVVTTTRVGCNPCTTNVNVNIGECNGNCPASANMNVNTKHNTCNK